MADLTTSKILCNIIISTINAKNMCVDIKKIYLRTLLNHLEYMRIPLFAFTEHIMQQYNSRHKSKNGYVYVEIRRSIYGLPQAGAISNKVLKNKTRPTWLFWGHTHSRIMETHHTPHLLFPCCRWFWCKIHRQCRHIPPYCCTEKHYEFSEYWTGGLYCGITLNCNYDQ